MIGDNFENFVQWKLILLLLWFIAILLIIYKSMHTCSIELFTANSPTI